MIAVGMSHLQAGVVMVDLTVIAAVMAIDFLVRRGRPRT